MDISISDIPDKTGGHMVRHVLATLFAGLICGLLTAMFSISVATLLFGNTLIQYLEAGIAMSLVGTIALCSMIAIFSSFRGMIGVTQEISVVALAVIATSIHMEMSGLHSVSEIFATIVAMIGIATMATGLVLFTMGVLRLGRVIRFIPYPVIGGFLAGMGWLIVAGAMGVVVGENLNLGSLPVFFAADNLAKWVPAALFAITVGAAARKGANPFLLPGMVFVALTAFHTICFLLHLSILDLQQNGWLFSPSQDTQGWSPLADLQLDAINWSAIWNEIPKIIALIAITTSAVLFASSGIELSVDRHVDLNTELRAAGLGNILAGAAGGVPGFQGLGLTLLAHRLGAHYRIVGIIVSCVCAAVLFWGSEILGIIPIPLFGGLLLWIGFSLLKTWLIDIYPKISRPEYAIVLLIVFLISFSGLLEGVLAGFFGAALLFVVQYSRIDIVRHTATGDVRRSHVIYGDADQRFLTTQGKQTLVLHLHGYVFFGTAHRLQQFIEQKLTTSEGSRVQFFVLDCKELTGLDSSALLSFNRICKMIRDDEGELLLANVAEAIQMQLAAEKPSLASVLHCFPDIDRALRYCENQILKNWAERPVQSETQCIAHRLACILQDPNAFEIMAPYLERIDLQKPPEIIKQKGQSHDIYLTECGQIGVEVKPPRDPFVPIGNEDMGGIVDAVPFRFDESRISSVFCESDTVVWRLSHKSLMQMARDVPSTASALNSFLIRMLSKRLVQATRMATSRPDLPDLRDRGDRTGTI